MLERYGRKQTEPLGRRREKRYDVYATAHIMPSDATALCFPMGRSYAVVEVSTHGLAVRSPVQILPRTPMAIDVQVGRQVYYLNCIVIHCTQVVGAYRVGVELSFAADDA